MICCYEDKRAGSEKSRYRDCLISDASTGKWFEIVFCCDVPWPLILRITLPHIADLQKVELKNTVGRNIPWNIARRIDAALRATSAMCVQNNRHWDRQQLYRAIEENIARYSTD